MPLKKNNGARGAAFERRVADYFRELGFFVVRAAGSHGVADLIAAKGYDAETKIVFLIQCKSGSARLRTKEWDEFFRSASEYGLTPLYAWRPTPRMLQIDLILGTYDQPERSRRIEIEEIKRGRK